MYDYRNNFYIPRNAEPLMAMLDKTDISKFHA